MQTQALDSFYEALLRSMLLVVEPEDNNNRLVSMRSISFPDKEPLIIDGRRLAMASNAALAKPQWDALQYYHPLCENVLRGESPVLKSMMRWITLRITAVAQSLLAQLIDMAADTDAHGKLNAKQHVVLGPLANVNEKTGKTFAKISERMSIVGDFRFTSLYLKASGTWKEQTWARVCSVRFPLMEELQSSTAEDVFGVKLTKKDRATLIEAMNYILPNCGVDGAYSFGSNHTTVPQFHALVSAYGNVAIALNRVTELFKKHLEHYDDLIIDVSWMDSLDHLSQWRETYATLPGNNGTTDIGGKSTELATPKFNASRLMNEVNTTPVAPVGNASTHQAPAVNVSTNQPTLGGLEIKLNPLGNLDGPAPAHIPAAGTVGGVQRNANGVVFGSLMATPVAPVTNWQQPAPQYGTYQQPQQTWQQPAPVYGNGRNLL